jgi:subtilase family serine protease
VIAVPIGAAPAVEPFGTLSPPFNPSAVTGAYGVNALSSLPNPTGAGVTIAIIDAYGDTDGTLTDHIQGDLQTFSSYYNLPYNGPATAQPTLTEVFPDGTPTSTDSSWALETALDVEWVHAIAPAAKIILVVATDTGGSLYNGVGYAIQHAPIVSMSWGGPEFSTEDQQDTTYFSAAGVTYFASTGDNGAGTEYPSVSPNVTAIGGTSITIGSGNTWGSETGWSGSGVGHRLTKAMNPSKARGFPPVIAKFPMSPRSPTRIRAWTSLKTAARIRLAERASRRRFGQPSPVLSTQTFSAR